MTFACLDKGTWHDKSHVGDSDKCRYPNDDRHHVWHAVHMANHTSICENMAGGEMAIMVDVVCAFIAIGRGRSTLRFHVVVEGNGKQHWHIDQYQ